MDTLWLTLFVGTGMVAMLFFLRRYFFFLVMCIAMPIVSEASETMITPVDTLAAEVWAAQNALATDASLPIAEIETHIVREKVTTCKRVKGKKKPVCRSSIRQSKVDRLKRRITLYARDEVSGDTHQVVLAVPHPLPESGFPFTVLTAGYEVEHLAGRGVVRLSFLVRKDGRDLLVLAAKHPWVPSRYWNSRDLEGVLARAETVVYTQPSPSFLDRTETPDLVRRGYVFWEDEAKKALAELDAGGVQSRTFPGRPIGERLSAELLVALGAIEQIDDRPFFDDPDRTADTIALHYALNKDEAFSRAVSGANARGAYQFTEKNGNGTYSLMVRLCSGAKLIPDFEAGTQDLRNMLKAAACYLDYERANLVTRITQEFGTTEGDAYLALWSEEPRLAAIYPVAAYNAGPWQGWKLYREFPPDEVLAAAGDSADELGLPKAAFMSHHSCRCGKKGKTVTTTRFNGETYNYLVKLASMWPIIERWRAGGDVSPVANIPPDACCVPEPAPAPSHDDTDVPGRAIFVEP